MPLGQLCDFQRGLTYAKGDEVEFSKNIVLRATNIDLRTNLLDLSELKYISEAVAVPASKRVQRGSLMICTASGSKSHLGKVAYIDADYGYAFGGFMGMITPKNGLLPKYLFHLMTSDAYKDFIGGLADGANINNLKFEDLKKFLIPFPASYEQSRIIRILDDAFNAIATAKANAEKNLQNAHALFESRLQDVFARRDTEWTEKRLGEVCTLKSGTTVSPAIERSVGDLPYLKVADMTHAGNDVEVSTSSRFLNRIDIGRNAVLPPGTTIFPKRGGAILTNKKRITAVPICADLNIMGVIPGNSLLPKYLYFFFLGLDMRRLGSGSSIPQINNYDIEPLLIAFPQSTGRQAEIVDNLDAVYAEAQRLEAIYQKKLAALAALKKSVLHRAFSGQL